MREEAAVGVMKVLSEVERDEDGTRGVRVPEGRGGE